MLAALTPAIILLAAGLAAIALSRQARLSPIVGFLIAGMALGPHGFGLIAENETTELLAKLGVVFLLFEIGMHLTVRTLRENRDDLTTLAPLQYLLTSAVFALIAWAAFGLSPPVAIAVGGALAISSTAVVARVLVDRRQGNCPVGRSAINVLIFQDIFAVFLLIYGASLMTEGAGGLLGLVGELGLAALKTVIGFALALTIGPLVLRPVFAYLARSQAQEAFTAIALLLAFTLAAGAVAVGLTETLGGFIAGMMIGATQYRHVIETEAKPFRALLLSFFFISVGMMVDLAALLRDWWLVGALTAGLIAVKTVCAAAAARLAGWSAPGSAQLSTLLAQGSEFAFIILALPAVAGAIPPAIASALIAAVALSLALTPPVSAAGAALARRLAKRAALAAERPDSAAAAALEQSDAPGAAAPIILYGMGPIGRRVADAFDAHEVPYVAIETDAERFQAASADGYAVVFGDPGDLRMMDTIGATHAGAIALSEPRYEISRDLTPLVRERYPSLARFVAVADEADAQRHLALGMNAIRDLSRPPGLAFASRLLAFAGVPAERIDTWRRQVQRREEARADSADLLGGADDARALAATPE